MFNMIPNTANPKRNAKKNALRKDSVYGYGKVLGVLKIIT